MPTTSPGTRCAGRSSSTGGQLDGQPGRDHVRLPGPGGGRCDPEQVTRAFVVCREVFGLATSCRVEALDNVVPTAAQTTLYLEFRRLLDRSSRWFLTSRPSTLDIGAEIERFSGVVRELGPQVPQLLRGEERRRMERKTAEFNKAGVPDELALHAASLLDWYSLLDIIDIAADTGRAPTDVAPLYYMVSERFGIDSMLTQGDPPPARRPLGLPGPWRAAGRPLRSAGVADPLGHRGRRVCRADPAAQWEAWRPPTRRPSSARRRRCRRSAGSTAPTSPRSLWPCGPCAR